LIGAFVIDQIASSIVMIRSNSDIEHA